MQERHLVTNTTTMTNSIRNKNKMKKNHKDIVFNDKRHIFDHFRTCRCYPNYLINLLQLALELQHVLHIIMFLKIV